MSEYRFKGHVGIGPKVRGPALVAGDGFSARYDLDRLNGVFSRPAHGLYGQSYVGCVLVLNTANPVMAQGAVLADVALVDRFDVDITEVIRTGDDVDVDPAEGLVIVRR